MTQPQHGADKPLTTTGNSAHAIASLYHQGRGALSRRREGAAITAAIALCVLLGALVLVSTSASADTSFGEGPTDAGKLGLFGEDGKGLAVDQATGDIYIGANQRVSKFSPGLSSLFAFGWGVANEAEEEQTCTVTCKQIVVHPQTVKGGLLAQAGGVAVAPTNGDVYVTDPSYHRIEKFDSEGHFLLSFGGDVIAYGPGDSANDEVQKVTVAAEGGTFKLEFEYSYSETFVEGTPHSSTGPLPYNASAAEVEAALNSLSLIGGEGGSVSVTGGPGDATGSKPYVVTFEGNLAGDDLRPLVPVSKTGEPPVSTLTGSNPSLKVETVADGGGPEVCKLSAGDACKSGGDRGSGLNGTFSNWPLDYPAQIAVGLTGTVYVGDSNRVQEFDSEGSYTGQINVPGGGSIHGVAVDGSANVFVVAEGFSGVREYDSSGSLIRTLNPPGAAKLVAVDSSGNLFVGAELHRGEPTVSYEFDEYDSAGTLLAQFHSALLKPAGTSSYFFLNQGMGIGDTANELYVTNTVAGGFEEAPAPHAVAIPIPTPGPPAVSVSVSDIQPSTATLHALVNPRSFDTEYHFEYVDQQHFESGGFSNPATESTPTVDLGLVNREDPVQAAISGLTPQTTYQFRVVAESNCNEAEPAEVCTVYGPSEFETLAPVTIEGLTTQTVGPELVTLKAELNPNGKATQYTFRLGKNTEYLGGTVTGALPAGNEFKKVQATFVNLEPNTTYHYQLSAENEYGKAKSADQTLKTESSLAEEVAAAGCENASLREEDGAQSLPDCRDYEQVSPSFKNGYPAAHASSIAPSGERIMYGSTGAFEHAENYSPPAAAQYVAGRTANGWKTVATTRNVAGANFVPQFSVEFSPELDRWLTPLFHALSSEGSHGEVDEGVFYMGHIDGSFTQASPVFKRLEPDEQPFARVTGASDDLSRFFLNTSSKNLPDDPRPANDSSPTTRLYEVAGADTPTPSMSLFAEVPLGVGPCRMGIGEETFRRRGVSQDGTVVAYVNAIENGPWVNCEKTEFGLFAREGLSPPVQVNVPPPSECSSPSPCATAQPSRPTLQGISPDGSLIWFETTQPLVNADKDSTNDLYVAVFENGAITELQLASGGNATDPSPGEESGDQGNGELSIDGTHAGFVASAVLTTEPNANGEAAAAGADNLYVYDASSGETKFVARLCRAPARSGSLPDSRCPVTIGARAKNQHQDDRNLWNFEQAEDSRMTPDGRFYVFSTFARLSPEDTDNTQDIYRYDFANGELIRVTFGRRGNDGNGNDNAYAVELPTRGGVTHGPDELAEDNGRAVSSDGSRIIFKTTAPLVSRDTNLGNNPGCSAAETGCDLYEWEEEGHGTCTEPEGCISLVSDGVDRHGVFGGNISSSGRDISFYTPRGLVPSDTDGIGDIYDARVGGGFHTPVGPPICLASEACRNQPGSHPGDPTIGSESFVGSGNGEPKPKCAKGKVRRKRHGQIRCVPKKHHKHHQKKGRGGK